MKLKLYLIDENKLILAPDNEQALMSSQVAKLANDIDAWNQGGRVGVLPIDTEVIDMRTPQREQIEAIVKEVISDMTLELGELLRQRLARQGTVSHGN